MNKKQVLDFNRALSYEPTAGEKLLIRNMLAVWGKLEPVASKNPSAIRKGIIFGMGLMQALKTGDISLPPVKENSSPTWAD